MTDRKSVKLLYAWDMGSNWGHIGHFLAVYPALKEAGFECAAAIPEVRAYGARLAAYGVQLFAAPRSEPRGRPPFAPHSLAHILTNRGYGSSDDLSGLVLAWRSLIQAVNPAVVLIDAAPAALLAAESLGVPTLLLTVPFFIPPAVAVPDDFLSGQPGSPLEQRRQLSSDLLNTVNEVRTQFGLDTISDLSGLYGAADKGLLTFEELDHNAPRAGSPAYRGALWNMGAGQSFSWPQGSGSKVFVYIRPPAVALTVLSALKRLGWPTVAYCPDFLADRRGDFAAGSVYLSGVPLDMGQVAREAELAVNYGSHGVAAGLLWHGIPQLIVPLDAEKELIAGCVVRMGAGIRPAVPLTDTAITMALNRLSGQSAYREAAGVFARKYQHMSQQTVVDSVVQSCLALAEGVR